MRSKKKHTTAQEAIIQLEKTVLPPMYESVMQRISLRARRRIAWLRRVWTEANSRENMEQGIHSEVDAYLDSADKPEAEACWYATAREVREINEALASTESALERDSESRLVQLKGKFGLCAAEMDLLQTCLALSIEPNLGRVFAYLQDHSGRSYVTGVLVARLFGHGHFSPLSSTTPVHTWNMVSEQDEGRGEPTRFVLDPGLRAWLLELEGMDEALAGRAQYFSAGEPLENWPVEETLIWIRKILEHPAAQQLRIVVAGSEGSGRRSFAAVVAARLGFSLLAINSDLIDGAHWASTYIHAQRHARLNRCAVAWHGAAAAERAWPGYVAAFPVQFIICETDEYPLPAANLLDYRVEIPPLSIEQRRKFWLEIVPSAATWPVRELDDLAQRRQVNIGQIAYAAARRVENAEEAGEAASAAVRRRLGELAKPLASDFTWDDLVVPEWLREELEHFVFEASERTALWEEAAARRLFPQGRGLLALFTGPPGTGKTMAAQVIASDLRLDLYRVDLSTIISKYVGETSKNIERILSRARQMDIVLFFDEADALFGKRTEIRDAHDRFANTDTNYLLQAIEEYPGIAILASNLNANIDSGFLRRQRFVMEFSKPEAPQRLQLWQRIAGELFGPERANAMQEELALLAEMVELTGAQIKHAVLSAVYSARQDKTAPGVSHLLRGLDRELLKEGRGLGRHIRETMKPYV